MRVVPEDLPGRTESLQVGILFTMDKFNGSSGAHLVSLDTPKVEELLDDEYRWLQAKAVEFGSNLNVVLCSRYTVFLQIQVRREKSRSCSEGGRTDFRRIVCIH